MIKHEAYWQTVFNQYLREKKWYGYFELKQTEAETFNLAKIEDSQWGLEAAEQSGLVWKFSDQDQRKKLCDTVSIPPLPAYLVIKFKDGFYILGFAMIAKMFRDGKKSLKRTEAMLLAERVVHI